MKWNLWRAALWGLGVEAFALAIGPDREKLLGYLLSGALEPELAVFIQLSAGPLIFVLVAWVHNLFVRRPKPKISN